MVEFAFQTAYDVGAFNIASGQIITCICKNFSQGTYEFGVDLILYSGLDLSCDLGCYGVLFAVFVVFYAWIDDIAVHDAQHILCKVFGNDDSGITFTTLYQLKRIFLIVRKCPVYGIICLKAFCHHVTDNELDPVQVDTLVLRIHRYLHERSR